MRGRNSRYFKQERRQKTETPVSKPCRRIYTVCRARRGKKRLCCGEFGRCCGGVLGVCRVPYCSHLPAEASRDKMATLLDSMGSASKSLQIVREDTTQILLSQELQEAGPDRPDVSVTT
jgi:hypothetical protein